MSTVSLFLSIFPFISFVYFYEFDRSFIPVSSLSSPFLLFSAIWPTNTGRRKDNMFSKVTLFLIKEWKVEVIPSHFLHLSKKFLSQELPSLKFLTLSISFKESMADEACNSTMVPPPTFLQLINRRSKDKNKKGKKVFPPRYQLTLPELLDEPGDLFPNNAEFDMIWYEFCKLDFQMIRFDNNYIYIEHIISKKGKILL